MHSFPKFSAANLLKLQNMLKFWQRLSLSTGFLSCCCCLVHPKIPICRTNDIFQSLQSSEEKQLLINDMFSKVAEKYDIMNDVMSFGAHRLWKDELISMLGIPAAARAEPKRIPRHLDVAGGTGDVAFRSLTQIMTSYGNTIRSNDAALSSSVPMTDRPIVVCDINPEMLSVGKQRATKMFKEEDRNLVSSGSTLS